MQLRGPLIFTAGFLISSHILTLSQADDFDVEADYVPNYDYEFESVSRSTEVRGLKMI